MVKCNWCVRTFCSSHDHGDFHDTKCAFKIVF